MVDKRTVAPARAKTPARRRAAPVAAPIETGAAAAEDAVGLPQPADMIPTAVETTAAPVGTATLLLNEETNVMQDTVKNTADKAQTMFSQLNDRTRSAVDKSSAMVADMNDFAKGNVEAMVESSKIAAKGFEAMGQDAAEYGRRSFEGATAAMQSFASVKSPTELFKLQSDYMRTAFDQMVAETSKTTETMLKLAGDVARPLSNRMAVAADKVKVAA